MLASILSKSPTGEIGNSPGLAVSIITQVGFQGKTGLKSFKMENIKPSKMIQKRSKKKEKIKIIVKICQKTM
jgi:hypothetical protein